MNDNDFEAACATLVAARRDARAVPECPPRWQPGDLGEAYRLQAAVIGAFGSVGAWKVGALTAAQRASMGLDTAAAGAIPALYVHDASEEPARLHLADFIAPLIECEFAFELGRDLPARRGNGYTRAEVAAATTSMRTAIELVDPRWPRGSGALAEIADGFNNGAFVAGPRTRDWSAIDLATTAIVVTMIGRNGTTSTLATGNGKAILDGDPFGAVVLLANAQPPGRGLCAGDIVTTGSCTGAPRLPGPGRYRAEFAGLGVIDIELDP